MRVKEALPEIFKRPVPVVAEGTAILVAGTLLDTPRRDVLPIVRSSDKTLRFVSHDRKHLTLDFRASNAALQEVRFVSDDRKHLMAFAGQAILSKLLEWNRQDHYMFLFEPIESASLSVLPIPADEEIASLFRAFVRTKFGWSIIEDSGAYALATLADLIPLYSRNILETSLCAKDVASPIFALPQDTKLSKALQEMIKHSVRRVFLSGTNRFVSDREILTYIFSPARLAVVRNSPHEMLEATLEDVGSVEPITVDGSASFRSSSPSSLSTA
ncbi:MAG: hypothetical protein M1368_10385 [Thaumarchaeota archaeon]|nr:hypothetical protein [Nitrososphaerota archaeon]